MGRTDTLINFVSDIAEAIRAKDGTSEPIPAADFSGRILAIPQGGGEAWQPPPLVPGKPVVRWLYTSTATGEERIVLTNVELGADALPPPDAGDWTASWAGKSWMMTLQGWSSTSSLTNVQHMEIDAGAMYIPEDGRTRLCISIAGTAQGVGRAVELKQTVAFIGYGAGTMTIDWGDDSTPTVTTATAGTNYPHEYAGGGDYVVEMERVGGTWEFVGLSATCAWGGNNSLRRATLVRLFIGSGAGLATYAFNSCYSLLGVTIPQGVTSVGTYAFAAGNAMRSIVIPHGVASIGNNAFNNCHSLRSVVIPHGAISIGSTAFAASRSLRRIAIPQGLEIIRNGAFGGFDSMPRIVIPASVVQIDAYAFNWAAGIIEYVLLSEDPSALVDVLAFAGNTADTRWYVPDASLAAYKAHASWLTLADRILPMSDLGDGL